MRKNKILNVWSITTVIMMLAIQSCSDFLDKPLQGQLTQSTFPINSGDALTATNGVYNTLRSSSYHFGLFPIMDIMSDDARKGSNPTDQGATIGPYDNFTHIGTESSVLSWWSTLFQGIRSANVVLEKVPSISMDTTLRSRYIGEASFLRGLFYFDLARGYGGVPIVTTTTPPTTLVRANLDDVYKLIISDLKNAESRLPDSYSGNDLGRATKGAARSLLAKVYLFMPQPGILNYVPQPDFVNAEKYSLLVINSSLYGLMDVFADANSQAGEYGKESIFEIGALPLEGQENGGDQYGNVQGVRGNPNRGWGFNRPSEDMRMNLFESGDPRRDESVIELGETLDGILIAGDGSTLDITRDANGIIIEHECYNQKVWTPGINVPTQFEYHRRLLRYADVLLIAAEASNENGKTSQALQYLNMVRARAREGNNPTLILPDIAALPQDQLRAVILHERRAELALEGNRFWDLVRTGNATAVLGPLGFVPGKHELLAIPQTEIDLSHGKIVQNQGWK